MNLHTHHLDNSGLCVVNLPRDGAFPTDTHEKRWYCYGIHPWWTGNNENETQLLEHLLRNNLIDAVGETGIDKNHPSLEGQLQAFEHQIALSETFQKPMILHNVKGTGEILQLHKKHAPRQTWIIHGFNGNQEEVQQLVGRGICLSVGSGILYENRKITKSLPSIPLDYLFFETDDTRMQVVEVYGRASELLSIPMDGLREKVFANFTRVFIGNGPLR